MEHLDEEAQRLVARSGWRVTFARLWSSRAEHFLCSKRIIIIDDRAQDREHAAVHAVTHVQLDHHRQPGGDFTVAQEDQADWLAAVWLDRLTEAS